jgi:hypothetical protein
LNCFGRFGNRPNESNGGGQALIGNAELKRTHIIVDGGCNSACTLVLGNADVCSTDRGFFYFHAALKDDAPAPRAPPTA